jgi:hypothetical protein
MVTGWSVEGSLKGSIQSAVWESSEGERRTMLHTHRAECHRLVDERLVLVHHGRALDERRVGCAILWGVRLDACGVVEMGELDVGVPCQCSA